MKTDTQLTAEAPPRFNTGLSIFDGGTFEGIMRVAEAMAHSPLVPESLRTKKVNGKVEDLSHEEIRANCFLVCEQSQRWGISPFAAIACASNIYGRLMWEGKLVAGVLEANLGVRLDYQYEGAGEKMTVTVLGTLPGETKVRTVKGSVADWKTDQWKLSAYEQRLAYRGAREWARRHSPSIMLGVLTEDEELPQIRNVTPRAVVRENPVSPFVVLPEPKEGVPYAGTATQYAAELEAARAAVDPKPATIPPTGKQKKARHKRDGKFLGIERQEGNGKTWWKVTVGIAGKVPTFSTFSTTLSDALYDLENGTPIQITAVANADGSFSLEDFILLENAKTEGDLV